MDQQQEQSNKRQVTHEQLGESTLLYRHAPSYTLLHDVTRQQASTSLKPVVSIANANFLETNRVKARFYDSSLLLSYTDKRPRLIQEELDLKEKDRYKQRSSIGLNITPGTENQLYADIFEDVSDAEILAEIRESIFPMYPRTVTMMNKLDQPYRDADKEVPPGTKTYQCVFTTEINASIKDLIMERANAAPEYLTSFGTDVLKWGMSGPPATSADEVQSQATISSTFREEQFLCYGPLEHGNCIISSLCPCCQSTQLLIHPTGEMLSIVSVSPIRLPQQPEMKPDLRPHPETIGSFDVGERILQITECSSWETTDAEGIYLIVRSSSYLTVVRVKPRYTMDCTFRVSYVKRIDLRSLSSQRGFRPRYVAAHPRYGNAFAIPLVAFVSKSDAAATRNKIANTTTNVIHTGIMETQPTQHNINNLQNIELIEFSAGNPMVLHAAATSHFRPKLVKHIGSKRPTLAHGSSLYTIDLRMDKATFQWSPSAEDFVTEGLHNISGIATDWTSEYGVFVSSISTGKMYEIDSRMPYRIVNSWELPGLTQNMGVNTSSGDLHGAGTLINIPHSQYKNDDVLCPIFSVDKTIGAFGLRIYQQPLVRPMLGTDNLEVLAGGMNGAAARSAVFPLPDVARSVFTIGLTSFRNKATDVLAPEQIVKLGYSAQPEMAVSIVTMTNNGDMYCNTFLESDESEQPRAVPLESGAMGLDVADFVMNDSENVLSKPWEAIRFGNYKFQVTICDKQAIPSHKVIPVAVPTRSEVEPFHGIPLEEVRRPEGMRSVVVHTTKEETDELYAYYLDQAAEEMEKVVKEGDVVQNIDNDLVRENGQKDILVLGDKLWNEEPAQPRVMFAPTVDDDTIGDDDYDSSY